MTLYIPILIGHGIDCIIGAGKVDFFRLNPILLEVIIIACATAVLQWLVNTINNRITFKTVRYQKRGLQQNTGAALCLS